MGLHQKSGHIKLSRDSRCQWLGKIMLDLKAARETYISESPHALSLDLFLKQSRRSQNLLISIPNQIHFEIFFLETLD